MDTQYIRSAHGAGSVAMRRSDKGREHMSMDTQSIRDAHGAGSGPVRRPGY
jgi:hypothetical protein